MFLFLYISAVLLISMVLEFVCGTCGVIFPITAMIVFYFSVSAGWRPGTVAALFGGTVIDLIYGRSFIITPFLLLLIALFSLIWLYKKNLRSPLYNMLPGTVTALIYTLPLSLINTRNLGLSFHYFFQNLSNLVFSVVISTFILPFIIILMDEIAEKLGMPQFSQERDRTQFEEGHKKLKAEMFK